MQEIVHVAKGDYGGANNNLPDFTLVILTTFTRYGDFSFCLFNLLGLLKCLPEFIVLLLGKDP